MLSDSHFRRALAALLVCSIAAPPRASRADAATSPEAIARQAEVAERVRAPSGAEDLPMAPDAPPRDAPTPALVASEPGGNEGQSAASASAMPLPEAEGSVEGMGESFSPDLGSGAATYSVPLEVMPGRAGLQPSLALAYSSGNGNGPLGIGWSLGLPSIGRQSDRGLPRYVDAPLWTAEEDRFVLNGNEELLAVDSNQVATADCGSPGCAPVPAEVNGWQQYRARVEGSFARVFRAPDGSRWVVQAQDGSRMDFGRLPTGDGPVDAALRSGAALLDEGVAPGRVNRWLLTRQSDAHGSTIYYFYAADATQRYLADIYYVSPHGACGALPDAAARRRCAAPFTSYGRRIRFVYEDRPDVSSSYSAGWLIETRRRLMRVEMTSAEGAPGARTLVRRYHLGYDAASYWSLLTTVTLEGRAQGLDPITLAALGRTTIAEESLGEGLVGVTAAPLHFTYTQPPDTSWQAPGLGGLDGSVQSAAHSPAYSVGANADLADVNSDGLPDLVVTDPAVFKTGAGAPAMGVFFNGFMGGDTTPDQAGSYSAAVAVPVPPTLAQVMRLSNANVSPMDVDGDGRVDYLHLPRLATTGYFTPARSGAPAAVTPAAQGWELAYVQRQLPAGDADPRVDLAHDGARLRNFDVNNDHLVDIVRTTGTSIQVWYNLGWLPGGDGRYGSYHWNAQAARHDLSTVPAEFCLPVAGTPLDFADPAVHVADMNGDGVPDIVRVTPQRVIYWPGRGEGAFGAGPASCPAGLVSGRHVELAHPPVSMSAEADGVFVADVNADGMDDIVQVRSSDVDVWLNYAGRRLAGRIRLAGTPWAPAFDQRVRLVDVDGSGTLDILYARANHWQWVDPLAGRRPRLLASVENNRGATVDIDYASSVDDYLRDLAEGEACSGSACERFTWSSAAAGCDAKVQASTGRCLGRSGGSPVISTVVRRVRTADHLDRLGGPASATAMEYRYHDAYYEGVEQEYRGFAAADVVVDGDPRRPSRTTRTHIHQGRRAPEIASARLADNPEEALKGQKFLVETFAAGGVHLSTAHSSYRIRRHATALNGQGVYFAVPEQSDAFLYDTGGFVASAARVTLPDVVGVVERQREVPRRGTRFTHVRRTIDAMDGLGHVLASTAHGRLATEEGEPAPDERVFKYLTFANVATDGGWLWVATSSRLEGHGASGRLGDTVLEHDASGDLTRVATTVTQPVATSFPGDALRQGYGTVTAPASLVSTTAHDVWGTGTATCSGGDVTTAQGCLRHARVHLDGDYALTAVAQHVATRRAGGTFAELSTTATWDRGLLLPAAVIEPGGEVTTVSLDGFGRVTAVYTPRTLGCGAGLPSVVFTYLDPADPHAQPWSRVHARTFQSCTDFTDVIETWQYFDALGRQRASLTTGDDDGTRRFIRSGLVELDGRGAIVASHQPDFFAAEPGDGPQLFAPPTTPPTRVHYDAFDRPVATVAEDGSETLTVYGASRIDLYDPLDLSSDPRYAGTHSTVRADGHGRTIDIVLRNRPAGGSGLELERLFTTYRADGAVLQVERLRSLDERPRGLTAAASGKRVVRQFFVDSVGRRVAATDPDADDPVTGATWRYLFNRVGDLVAVRDPRGCGQNLYYDLAGRSLAEAYVPCAAAQRQEESVATLAAGAVGLDETTQGWPVDRASTYDTYVGSWLGSTPSAFSDYPSDAGSVAGRLVATIDRGHRSVYAYDRRGNMVWEARQLGVIADAGAVPATLTTVPAPVPTTDALDGVAARFDSAHTYVRAMFVDHGNRSRAMLLPPDPDFVAGGGTGPRVLGTLTYGRRGMPVRSSVSLIAGAAAAQATAQGFTFPGGTAMTMPVVASASYARDGRITDVVLGDDLGGTRAPTTIHTDYDVRRRPWRSTVQRAAMASAPSVEPTLRGVSLVQATELTWDAASNLVGVADGRVPGEWPAGHRPQHKTMTLDALYRVVGVDYEYTSPGGGLSDLDLGTDWRAEETRTRNADPSRRRAAPMVPVTPSTRVASLAFAYDWLGNMTSWSDDAHAFFERSLGAILNGNELGAAARPSALYLATDLGGPPADRGSWAEADYGAGGFLVDLAVHGRCTDAPQKTCVAPTGSLAARRASLRDTCRCQREQYYQYRWDELGRLTEARRYDREGGLGSWALGVRQRYRYDGNNRRLVKQTIEPGSDFGETISLSVFSSDFERRGLQRSGATYVASSLLDTQSEYLVSDARLVWQAGAPLAGVDADHRLTYRLRDLVGTTAAVVDLRTGELTQVSTHYPMGGRETLLVELSGTVPIEPAAYSGMEDDAEVGLIYYGERYLVPGLGRWASADPLSTHAIGGGEPLNSYHFVSGRFLQNVDVMGLGPAETADAKSLIDKPAPEPLFVQANMTADQLEFTLDSFGLEPTEFEQKMLDHARKTNGTIEVWLMSPAMSDMADSTGVSLSPLVGYGREGAVFDRTDHGIFFYAYGDTVPLIDPIDFIPSPGSLAKIGAKATAKGASHVGMGARLARKIAVFNPMRLINGKAVTLMDNCVGSVTAFLKTWRTGKLVIAHELPETSLRLTGKGLGLKASIEFMESNAGVSLSNQAFDFGAKKLEPGMYVIFGYGDVIDPVTGAVAKGWKHTAVGVVKPNGTRYIFDPQVHKKLSMEAFQGANNIEQVRVHKVE